jgi:hypothetical protein
LASDCGAGHYFLNLLSLHAVLNVLPFPLSKEKFLGDFCANRQSAAKSFPRFAYSFVSLMQRQYYWCCDFYSAYRQNTAIENKICEIVLLALTVELTPL